MLELLWAARPACLPVARQALEQPVGSKYPAVPALPANEVARRAEPVPLGESGVPQQAPRAWMAPVESLLQVQPGPKTPVPPMRPLVGE